MYLDWGLLYRLLISPWALLAAGKCYDICNELRSVSRSQPVLTGQSGQLSP